MKPTVQHFEPTDIGSLLTPSSMKSDIDTCELVSGASYVYTAAAVPKVYGVFKCRACAAECRMMKYYIKNVAKNLIMA